MVKQGYKQTEIGVIPEDWEVKKVSEISRITTGNKNTQDKIDNGIYPFFVRSQIVERINSFSFDGEAVLTAGDGVGVGKVFHYINGKFDYHQRVYAISHFDSNISGFYFFKYFQNNFYNRIMQMTAKSSVDSVRMETIADMQIPLPPLAEQEAIASALSDADAWIDSLEQLIAKKRGIKQGAMQTLLTPPSHAEALEAWEVKKLGEVSSSYSGGTPNTANEEYYKGEINFIGSGDLNQSIIRNVEGKISELGLNNSSAKMIDPDTLLIAMYGATAGVVAISKIKGAINQAILAVLPNRGYSTHFIYYFFSLKKEWIIKTYTQGGQPNLSGGILKNIEIPFPSLSEQERIATILSDMDAELEALATQLGKARQIKQGMMQELLTGRIRLV